jgi:hypothetical protein
MISALCAPPNVGSAELDNRSEREMESQRNRLAESTSPYLLQHADNPVDWYPWGQQAIQRAKAEDKPIFLSIGYSACHWCHVMEHESFENEEIAALMNEHFVSVKVDREERPDLDDIYMTFVQLTTGSGGWPMSVFLTPELKPFFGGTYFPPEERYGRPGFATVLSSVAEAWRSRREDIMVSSENVTSRLQQLLGETPPLGEIPSELFGRAAEELLDSFDAVEGGFSGPPKFPPSYSLSLLMRRYLDNSDERFLKAVTRTLDKMAAGGMYDQLGGGFHRYSVDAYWLVPHFEKMLYDNALLSWTYFEGYQLTGNTTYWRVGKEILDYVLRDMTDPSGGFHSSEDADSEGEEGKFYVWTPEEVIEILGGGDGRLFCDYYDVTNSGNFESGKSILHERVSAEVFAEKQKMSQEELLAGLERGRERLLQVREKRVRPAKDDKILADWNGLMLSSFAKGYQLTREDKYLKAAVDCANFLKEKLFVDPVLMHTYREGTAAIPGFLSDYAFVCNGLIDLYEAGFDLQHLRFADHLARLMIERFADPEGGLYRTAAEQDNTLIRQKTESDGAVPSGGSVAALALSRLAFLRGEEEYRLTAKKLFASMANLVNQSSRAYHYLLNSYHFFTSNPPEIAVVGDLSASDTWSLLARLHSEYRPNKVLALAGPNDSDGKDHREFIPLLKSRDRVDGKATAYVCHNFACRVPATNPEELAEQLR